jgi:hypothetical protein
MTVKQLMADLAKMPPDAKVRLSIGNPEDTAWTDEVQQVDILPGGKVTVRGWVSSDNDGAFAPWSAK